MESPFPWPGGKRALKGTLLKLIPEHSLYVEVFAGSAKLLFAKAPSKMEVMNDLNGEVINFFRVAKHRPAELAERLESGFWSCVGARRPRAKLSGRCASPISSGIPSARRASTSRDRRRSR